MTPHQGAAVTGELSLCHSCYWSGWNGGLEKLEYFSDEVHEHYEALVSVEFSKVNLDNRMKCDFYEREPGADGP